MTKKAIKIRLRKSANLMLGLITRASDKTKKTRVVIALMYSFESGPLTCTQQLMMIMINDDDAHKNYDNRTNDNRQ